MELTPVARHSCSYPRRSGTWSDQESLASEGILEEALGGICSLATAEGEWDGANQRVGANEGQLIPCRNALVLRAVLAEGVAG